MARVFSLLFYLKIFQNIKINYFTKIIIIYLLSSLLIPFISVYKNNFCTIDFFLIFLNQIFIGIVLGFLIKNVLFGLFFIGEIFSLQIGLSSLNFFYFDKNTYSLIFSNLFSIFFLFTFFICNMHLKLLVLLIHSFEIYPLNNFIFYKKIFFYIVNFLNIIFFQSVSFILPILFFFLILYITYIFINKLIPKVSFFSSFMIIVFFFGMFILKYFFYNFYLFNKILMNVFLNYFKKNIIKKFYISLKY
ncbi:flagellar biosynthetic protein FliR [Buchnera aphidicola]|nr:flagellar biosynthetic protein FliR [Buchnera aphidicola]